jgi:hypothetical protein
MTSERTMHAETCKKDAEGQRCGPRDSGALDSSNNALRLLMMLVRKAALQRNSAAVNIEKNSPQNRMIDLITRLYALYAELHFRAHRDRRPSRFQ